MQVFERVSCIITTTDEAIWSDVAKIMFDWIGDLMS
jgi:hypothetical protein